MKKRGHYDVSDLIEAQFEPGSHGRVLKNLLRIKSKREMDQVEAEETVQAGLDRDYTPMEKVFNAVIRRTRRIHER
jgi:hypothetical protein